MQCGFRSKHKISNHSHRRGLLYFGALKEMLIISLALGMIWSLLGGPSSFFKLHSSPQEGERPDQVYSPVLTIDYDQDQQSILVHAYPDSFEEIDLHGGEVVNQSRIQGLCSLSKSSRNSVVAMLVRWVETGKAQGTVTVTRDGQFVLSETLKSPGQSLAEVHVSSEGHRVILVSQEGDCIAWDLSADDFSRKEFRLPYRVCANGLTPDGQKLLAVSLDGQAAIYDARTGEIAVSLPKIPGCCRCVSWSDDGKRLAVADRNGGIFVLDVSNGEMLWENQLKFMCARSLSLSSKGNRLAVCGFDKDIRVWDLNSPQAEPQLIKGNTSLSMDFVFTSNDSRLISGCLDGSIREWSLEKNSLIRQIR